MFNRFTATSHRHRQRAARAACLAFTLLAGLLAAGCSAPRKIDPDFVADRWSMTLRAFNIDPIFLPRQVHLGDVYLSGEPDGDPVSDANRWKRRTIYLGRADVREAIFNDTRSRLRLPGTSVSNPGDNVFEAPATTTLLRPVAFPGFDISEIRESDLAAAFPVKLFRALFGASRTSELVMSVSIPSAEYEEVPALAAWEKFGEFCWKKDVEPVCSANNPVLRHLFNTLKLPTDTRKLIPRVGIVTSVYYVRQINYFYNTGRATAFGASASLPASASAPQAPGAAPKPAAAAAADTATATASTPASASAPSSVPSSVPSSAPSSPSGTPSAGTGKPSAAATGSAATAAAAAPKPGTGKDSGKGNITDTGTSAEAPAVDEAGETPPASASAETARLHAQVQALQKRIDALQQAAGGADKYGAIRVVSSTSEGTALSQTFEQPVAIGYRALWIYPLDYQPAPAAAPGPEK